MINAAEVAEVQLLAENALEGGIYDADALQRMLLNSKHFDRCNPIAILQRAGINVGQNRNSCQSGQAKSLPVGRHMSPPYFLAASHTLHIWACQMNGVFQKYAHCSLHSEQDVDTLVLTCRITLLRLKPYMFEPDISHELRVKEPLASFLGKFRKVPA